jgi:hypothetical protein
MIRQAFGEETMSHTARQAKSKIKSILVIFFDVKKSVRKEFVLAGQIVNSVYYCDVSRRLRENVRSLRLELWRQNNWLLHHDNTPSHTSIFAREFFTKSNMTVPPPPTFLFSRVKIKLKGRHFVSLEVIEACVAEHSRRTRLPGCSLKIAEALITVHTRGRGLLLR